MEKAKQKMKSNPKPLFENKVYIGKAPHFRWLNKRTSYFKVRFYKNIQDLQKVKIGGETVGRGTFAIFQGWNISKSHPKYVGIILLYWPNPKERELEVWMEDVVHESVHAASFFARQRLNLARGSDEFEEVVAILVGRISHEIRLLFSPYMEKLQRELEEKSKKKGKKK